MRASEMNKWQKIFAFFGIAATSVLILFPPQVVFKDNVRFLPITYDYPIEWMHFFLWFLAIIFVTVLGIAVNKDEHK